jgi:hypothetical protein
MLLACQRLLSACTPTNLASERERLTILARAGVFENPRFAYAPLQSLKILVASDAHAVWKEKAEELALHEVLVRARGTSMFDSLRLLKWNQGPAASTWAEADVLAETWLAAPFVPDARNHRSSGAEPDSLRSRLARALRETYYRVVVTEDLGALAATGQETVYVAPNRKLSAADVERTVLHEVEGHALPRVRALARGLALPVLSAARGADLQEGYALSLEHEHGHLKGERCFTLALRHLAAKQMVAGAQFVDVVRWLSARTEVDHAVNIACRLFRGSGEGERPGLGREYGYIPHYCSVRAFLRDAPEHRDWLRVGQLSLDAVATLVAAGVVV